MSKFRYERSGWRSWGFGIRSRDDERAGYAHVRVPGHWLQAPIPDWLCQPILKFRDLSGMVGKDGYAWLKPNKDGRYGYTEVIPREYSLSTSDSYLHVRYGASTHDSDTDKSWCKKIPWLSWRFVRWSIYGLDGKWLADIESGKRRIGWEMSHAMRDAQPKAGFLFRDFDGEEIKARCRVEEREWRFGTGWFRWLSLFRKPMIRRSLDLEFSSEVGRRKGSWKGGTIGHSTEIAAGESPETAFRRYCVEQKLEFIGPCEVWKDNPRPADQSGNACATGATP